ncbi:MAG: aminoglycoside phosphotransferase family protein [Pseudomonadales bacterium]|jgi:aminoglycoside phosphotransferase (APT) family kinase protein
MTRLHADQIESDERLVERLIAEQFPRWAGLPVRKVATSGTENAIYRLGRDLVVRLPYRPARTEQVDKLDRWLPELARHLPLAIPETLARGVPSEAFPAAWSVLRWLDGEEVALSGLSDPVASAVTLAEFVRALLAIDTAGGPAPGEHNFWRGVPLADRDEMTRRAIEASGDLIDGMAVTQAWERDLAADVWRGPPTWLHGDLAPDNLLHQEGRLTAVIDWGGLGVGDPATELLPAWNLFRGESRRTYREALGFDDATWARGRGLALSTAIVALPYYRTTIPVRADRAMQVIREVLADHLEN